ASGRRRSAVDHPRRPLARRPGRISGRDRGPARAGSDGPEDLEHGGRRRPAGAGLRSGDQRSLPAPAAAEVRGAGAGRGAVRPRAGARGRDAGAAGGASGPGARRRPAGGHRRPPAPARGGGRPRSRRSAGTGRGVHQRAARAAGGGGHALARRRALRLRRLAGGHGDVPPAARAAPRRTSFAPRGSTLGASQARGEGRPDRPARRPGGGQVRGRLGGRRAHRRPGQPHRGLAARCPAGAPAGCVGLPLEPRAADRRCRRRRAVRGLGLHPGTGGGSGLRRLLHGLPAGREQHRVPPGGGAGGEALPTGHHGGGPDRHVGGRRGGRARGHPAAGGGEGDLSRAAAADTGAAGANGSEGGYGWSV
ncbi:MAG: hypothetical protein AVDCRST_MAG50-2635, partial [uncultured Acidimicrobiales bacterium]